MKIIGIQISNMRKIKALAMEIAERGLIKIVGDNEMGKSTILDCLEALLRGKKYLPKDIVSHGEASGEVILQLDEWRIERLITEEGNSRLKVTADDGREKKKPQDFLNTLTNELTFDPFPFLEKTADEKRKSVMNLAGIDFSATDQAISELEEERKLLGRELKRMGVPVIVQKVERVDISDILEFNIIQERQKRKIEDYTNSKLKLDETIEEYERHVLKLKKEREQLIATFDEIKPPQPLKDTEALIRKNTEADKYEHYLNERESYGIKEKEHRDKDNRIKELRKDKLERLSGVKLPVSGLEIKEGGLYHNGIFSENWSDSEGIKISCELCAAMNPELRAIFVDRGETFGKERLEALKTWAESNDIQCFITIVDTIPDDLEVGVFYIEEGNIKREVYTHNG